MIICSQVEEEDEHGKTYFMIGELWCQEDNWVAACLAFDNAIKWMPEFGDEFEVIEKGNRV